MIRQRASNFQLPTSKRTQQLDFRRIIKAANLISLKTISIYPQPGAGVKKIAGAHMRNHVRSWR